MSQNDLLDELSLYLRPPGQGIYTVSSGKLELEKLTKEYLGATWDVNKPWRDYLNQIPILKGKDAVALLAVPCDTGAGILRGASRGPEAMRTFLGKAPVFDLGDVFIIPQLLDDGMLSAKQIQNSQDALYPNRATQKRKAMPVSPLSMTKRVYEILLALNPKLKILLLGGDHTVTWPALDVLLSRDAKKNQHTAVVHFDAHTDLSPQRLGVKYCFSTWAYHVNERLGQGQRLLQIGIRASASKKDEWENKLGVKQIWADEALKMSPAQLAEKIVNHLRSIHAKKIYISNDLDGTDSKWASACGTPEPNGLTPDHVTAVIAGLAAEGFEIIGADVVELAPDLSLDKQAARTSIETAVKYLHAELAALQKGHS